MSVNSVKGFRLSDGSTAKYDYAYLENIITDKELTQEDVAADGKAVGDAIDGVENEITELEHEITDAKTDLSHIGEFFFTQTKSSKTLNVDVSASVGDRVCVIPVEWEGATASSFQINAYTTEWVSMGTTASIGTPFIFTATEAISKISLYVNGIGSVSTATKFSAYIFVVNNIIDSLSDIIINNLFDVSETEKDITTLEALNLQDKKQYYGNLLPFAIDSRTGYIVNDNNGKLVYTSNGSYVSYVIPVKQNTTYSVTHARYACLLDSDAETLIGSRVQNKTSIATGEASYLAFSFAFGDYPISSYVINEGATRGTYTKGGLKIPNLVGVPTFTVAKDGSGDYLTLTDAVANASDGDVIYVKAGVYEDETVEANGKEITIVGDNPYTTIIKNDYDDYSTPPIEMSKGRLINLQFYSEGNVNTRHAYALHIEDDSELNSTLYVENCIFKTDISNGSVGAGMRMNTTLTFHNCQFWNGNGPAFFGNESTRQQCDGTANTQRFQFYNCTFKIDTASSVVIMRGAKSVGTTVECTFVDCKFVDDGSTNHPAFRMDYTTSDYIGTSTTDGDMGIINWNLDRISSGNTIPDLNVVKDGEMYIVT